MKNIIILLVIISIAVIGYLSVTTEETPPELVPVRADETLRNTTAGDVVGFIDTHDALAWKGIPFAQPPNANLRWRAPQPPEPWEGVRETLAASDMCPQMKSGLSGDAGEPDSRIAGIEDCLYLNIWSPPGASNLPVMFWIHGGGNSIGHGGSYNGATLATRENVVLVIINYRLGPLGWFSHPALDRGDPLDDSGNFGTLDAVAGLMWTRDNIAAFGGNPDNVTVFGESAGAFDTLAMIASPLAAGLFHRAIVQSGGISTTTMESARNQTADGGHEWSSAEIVNRLLVKDGTVPDLPAARSYQSDMGQTNTRDYLYAKSVEDIFSIFDSGGFGMLGTPAIFADGHVIPTGANEEIFGDPDNHNMVPVILGTNRDEVALFLAQSPEYKDTFLWMFPRLKNEDKYLRSVRYGTLAWKERGVDNLAKLMTAAGNPNVYAYRFDWDEQGSIMGYDMTKAFGAAHALEIPFVFGSFDGGISALGPFFKNSPGKEALSEAMMSYWGEFAHAGNPGRGSAGTRVPWTSWGTNGQTAIVFDTEQDRGIRMMDEEVTVASIKTELESDSGITDARERCALYVRTFRSSAFDEDEYQNFGPDGCAEFEVSEFAGF
jgi:para-nitrobenzyl esterase